MGRGAVGRVGAREKLLASFLTFICRHTALIVKLNCTKASLRSGSAWRGREGIHMQCPWA